MPTVLLVSLRANPAFVQHMFAYAEALRELGYTPAFLVDPAYDDFSNLQQAGLFLKSLPPALAANPTHAIFFNPALANLQIAKALKRNGTRILYLYHEPWQMSLKYLLDEGIRDTCKAILAHRFTIPMLRLADRVLVASRYALGVYQDSDIRYNPCVSYLPLLYDDDAPSRSDSLIQEKKYFSFIGNPCRAHGFDQFLNVMKAALPLDMETQFLIASRFPLPKSVLREPIFTRNRSRIVLRCGRAMSNEEINTCYRESICVWNVYRRSTQSGVLPKALMFGAPLVCSNIGSFPQYLASGEAGRIVSGSDPAEILRAFRELQDNLPARANQCRRLFLSTFYYRAHIDQLAGLLGTYQAPFAAASQQGFTPGSECK